MELKQCRLQEFIGQKVRVKHERFSGIGILKRVDPARGAIAWVELEHGEDRWYEATTVLPLQYSQKPIECCTADTHPQESAPSERESALVEALKFAREEMLRVGFDAANTSIKRLDAVLHEAGTAEQGDGWISVEERLPEIGKPVLGYKGPTFIEGMTCQKSPDFDDPYWCYLSDGDLAEDVTHWRPLPDPPATAEQEKERAQG